MNSLAAIMPNHERTVTLSGHGYSEEWERNPSETDSVTSQLSSKTSSVGKRTAQKDAIKDTTSDSQVKSCFPYRWPPARLTFNIYFYLFFILIYNKNNAK